MHKYLLLTIIILITAVEVSAQYDDFKIVQNTPIYYPVTITRNENSEQKTKTITNPNEIYQYLSVYPVEQVWEKAKWNKEDGKIHPYLDTTSGMILHGLYYKVYRDSDTIVINSPDTLKKYFTPITDEMMALAYIHILKGYIPMHNFSFLLESLEKYNQQQKEKHEKWKQEEKTNQKKNRKNGFIPVIPDKDADEYSDWLPSLPQLETSYIKIVDDGYEMLLYKYNQGRGSSSYSVIKILLSKNGELRILSHQAAMGIFFTIEWD